jgi:hypothetical protein
LILPSESTFASTVKALLVIERRVGLRINVGSSFASNSTCGCMPTKVYPATPRTWTTAVGRALSGFASSRSGTTSTGVPL